jgi:ketosteroid isomerase-like protein
MTIQITARARRMRAAALVSFINIICAAGAQSASGTQALPGTQLTAVAASDTRALDRFGAAVALGRHFAIVGAPGNDSSAGAAYVFAPDWRGHWTEQAKLVPPDGAFDSKFGTSVAIAGDTALVGTGVTDAEAAHVFVRHGATWVREARLEVPSGQLTVALSADGNRAVVGVSGAAQSPVEAVYVFARQLNGQWTREAILSPAAGHGSTTAFGSAVAISGNTLVVGANAEDTQAGAVYVFLRNASGAWRLQSRIPAPPEGVLTSDAAFGWDVALSGGTLVVGAFGYDYFRGAAYVFQQQANGRWAQQARLDPQDTNTPFQCFGVSVAVTPGAAIIGQPCDGERGGTATHVYVFEAGFGGKWTQRKAFVSPAGNDTSDFGLSLATNGISLLLGSPSESTGGTAYAVDCVPCVLLGSPRAANAMAWVRGPRR